MGRPFNRRQAQENDAFLAALRRTGNAREAARTLGLRRPTMIRRRNCDAAFAAEWDAALALAHARLNAAGRAVAEGGRRRCG
jgi:Bacterial regulatory protein, Fis family